MSTFALSPMLRRQARNAFAACGWIAFAALAAADLRPHAPPSPPAAPAAAAGGVAGPASPAFLDEAPEPLPPTF